MYILVEEIQVCFHINACFVNMYRDVKGAPFLVFFSQNHVNVNSILKLITNNLNIFGLNQNKKMFERYIANIPCNKIAKQCAIFVPTNQINRKRFRLGKFIGLAIGIMYNYR